jgi:hypothetical protein
MSDLGLAIAYQGDDVRAEPIFPAFFKPIGASWASSIRTRFQ